MQAGAELVTIPGGFWGDDGHRRDVHLRPMQGEDEAFLHETAGGQSLAAGDRPADSLRRPDGGRRGGLARCRPRPDGRRP